MMRIEWDRHEVRVAEAGRVHWPGGKAKLDQYSADCACTDMNLVLMLGGTGKMSFPSGWADLRPDVCLWLRPGWSYDIRQDPGNPIRLFFIHFDFITRSGRIRPYSRPLPPERFVPAEPRLVEAIMSRLVEDAYGFGTQGYAIPSTSDPFAMASAAMFRGLLMSLDAETDTGSPPRQRFLRQVAARINESVQAPSVQELARDLGFSVNHFIRRFRESTHTTPRRFIIHARLARARRLLADTDLPVGQIAANLGYRDVFFFSKQFKQYEGVSPLRFRTQRSPQRPSRPQRVRRG